MAIQSVCFERVMSLKSKDTFYWNKILKDISTLKAITKPSFRGLNRWNHSKLCHPYITYSKSSLLNSFDAKIIWNWRLQIMLSGALYHWEYQHAVNWSFFISPKRENSLQHTIGNEMSTLARLTFCENLLIGHQKVSIVRINGCPY